MVAEISGDNKNLAAASCKHSQKTCCCTATLAVIHPHKTCSSSSNNIRVESYYRNIFLFNKRIQLLADSLTVHRHHCKASNPFFFQLFNRLKLFFLINRQPFFQDQLDSFLLKLLSGFLNASVHFLHKGRSCQLSDNSNLYLLIFRCSGTFPFFLHIAHLFCQPANILCYLRIDPSSVVQCPVYGSSGNPCPFCNLLYRYRHKSFSCFRLTASLPFYLQ